MESRQLIAFSLAFLLTAALTPLARRVALASGLLDFPTGWKTHPVPTPYLGGAAVLAGATGASLLAPDHRTSAILLGTALALSAVGTVDDAIHLHFGWRLGAELGAACSLWAAGLGWHLNVPEGVNLLLTCVWVVAVVNAVNLIDLIDTLAASVLIASAGALAVLAYFEGQTTASLMSLALAGAALGFLPFNMRPSRIFLGDGGTIALGFLVAGLIMVTLDGAREGAHMLLVGPLLILVPLLDAFWRAFTRMKAGVSVLTAGEDSVANALQRIVLTPGRVGFLLGAAQAVFGAVALVAIRGEAEAVEVAAVIVVGASLVGLRRTVSASSRRRATLLRSRE